MYLCRLSNMCAKLGYTDMNIVGNGSQAAFVRIKPPSSAPTYPMLWGHDAQLEKRMVVAPDSEGRVKPGRESRAAEIWDTRSHAHHNRDFRFNSQPLAVAFTETQTIGGRAWPNVKFDDRRTRSPTRCGVTRRLGYCATGGTPVASRRGAAVCRSRPSARCRRWTSPS